MSKAHFAHKNLPWDSILKILCYNTETPLLLSKKQRVSRLYKSYLRTNYDRVIRGTLSEKRPHLREMFTRGRVDFEYLLNLNTESIEFERLIKKYETFINDNYDPSMLLFDNQPFSPNSQKVIIYTDEVC
jgi:hypothetical protein